MRIGILTQPLWGNYGGILQNYALQTVLKRLGHTPKTVHYYRGNMWNWVIIWIKYIIKCIIRHPNRKYKPQSASSYIYGRYNGVYTFCKHNIIETFPTKGIKVNKLKEFDAYVVGSDQTWRPAYNFGDRLLYMYLDFVQGNHKVKKIAYAASFGVDNWEYNEEQTEMCKPLVQELDAISVREASGINLCRDYLGVNAQHLLDPTLLLSVDDYRLLLKDKKFEYDGDVCVYILDMTPQKRKMVNDFCHKNNLKWFRIGAELDNGNVPSVESWIAGFDKAKYVITDSFHGSVFSIIFNKPFISIGNDNRGLSRFHSLLSIFNLKDRLVAPSDTIENIDNINWSDVGQILSQWQKKSIDFLKTNLEK